MVNDASRMQNELRTIMSLMPADATPDDITVRLEEVMYRYNIEHKTTETLEDDLLDKGAMFISAKTLEGLSSKTLRDYEMELSLFARYSKKAVIQIQTPDIRQYLASLTSVQTSTIGKKLSVLKSFFGWLVVEEILLRDPTAKIRMPKRKKRLPKGLSVQEFEWIRELCETKRQRAIVEVLYSTGCRLSELASMNRSAIDTQDMSTTVVGKGDKERRVYLTFMAYYHLTSYLKSRTDKDDAVFATERRPHRRMHIHSIADEVDKLEQRSGINKKITPHVFRHTLAQTMLDNGATLEEVQGVLGHENIGTTQIYAHVSEERKQQSHKRYA